MMTNRTFQSAFDAFGERLRAWITRSAAIVAAHHYAPSQPFDLTRSTASAGAERGADALPDYVRQAARPFGLLSSR